jgi:hypothetical protein
MDVGQIQDYFDRHKAAVEEYKIEKEDVYSPAILRVGVGRGQSGCYRTCSSAGWEQIAVRI